MTAGTVVNSATEMSRNYILSATNTSATNSHFGWKSAGSISGKIFLDINDDGIYSTDRDVGTALIVTFTHSDASIPVITLNIASGDKDYSVTGVVLGDWTVSVTGVPATYKASFDLDDMFDFSTLASTPNTTDISVNAILVEQNFGYVQGGLLSGVIKHDINATGVFDPSSDGLEIELSLLDSSGNPVLNSAGEEIIVKTNVDGEFSVRNLDSAVDYKLQTKFGPSAPTGSPLADMEPSYDSEVGTISLVAPVSSTVNMADYTHTVLAPISSAINNEILATDLYFGYIDTIGDLTIRKTALKDNVVVGDIVSYTITIENNKTSTAFNVIIKD